MRLVYFGTPDFASRCLRKILSSKHGVAAVVTAPERPGGRGRRLSPTAVDRLAVSRDLEIMRPDNLKDPSFLKKLESFGADLFCVVAFRILPEEVFSMPPRGCINLHASLLPKYRGAAPINWALINGERVTGLTTFLIQKKVDTGDLILQEEIKVGPDETFGELHDRLADLGGDLLIRSLELIESGDLRPSKQDDSQASAAPKISSRLGRIDWSQSAEVIHNLVRGLSPKPGAFTYSGGRRIAILRTAPGAGESTEVEPGTVIIADPVAGITVACGQGTIRILQLKPESGRVLTGAEFVRGRRLQPGARFTGESPGA